MKSHWLDLMEREEESKYELSQFQRELENAYTEKIELEYKLKTINYRIAQLKENINTLLED